MSAEQSELLQRFPSFRSSDPEVVKEMGRTIFGATKVDPKSRRGFEARANFVQLQNVALAFASINSDISICYPESDFVRLQIGRSGFATTRAGGQVAEVHERQACVTSVGLPSQMICSGDNRRLTLRVKGSALDQKLVSLLGFRPKGALLFEPAMNLDRPYARGLLNMALFLAQQLESTAVELPPLVLREFEQAIVTTMLCGSRHSFSGLLEQDMRAAASPVEVRRAEEYIEANWQQPVSIEDLAAVTGVSARHLFRTFRKARGYSPMGFVKTVRLNRARDMLAAAHAGASVTAVAFKCGFGNPGHFARDYRAAFGELPSETLLRARRR